MIQKQKEDQKFVYSPKPVIDQISLTYFKNETYKTNNSYVSPKSGFEILINER